MNRTARVERKTNETQIRASLDLDGQGKNRISTGIGFFDHMLTLFSVHGLFDLEIEATGDLEVDFHHTVEDVGLVLGDAISQALAKRRGICRYGHATIPMDDSLAEVTLDLSNRPYMVFRHPEKMPPQNQWDSSLAQEFFRAVAQKAGMNLHIHMAYGKNWHHMVEAAFKGFGRALRAAVSLDPRMPGIPTTKGSL
jgi:imidazoleglycerol-phosphate dehydratase